MAICGRILIYCDIGWYMAPYKANLAIEASHSFSLDFNTEPKQIQSFSMQI